MHVSAFRQIEGCHSVKRALLRLLLMLFASVLSHAERLPVHVYTTADGLGSSAVNWILRDSRGFLWFATRDGLSRFDGQKFTTYRVEPGKNPSVTQIIERRRGDYLVLLQSNALYRFDSQTPVATDSGAVKDDTLTLQAQRLASDVPGTLFEDHLGRLWVISTSGIFLMAESDGHLSAQPFELKVPGQSDAVNYITNMIETRDGSLWLTTNLGLVRRADDGRVMLYGAPPALPNSNFLVTMCEDTGGRIWIGSQRGVYVLLPLALNDPAAFISRSLTEAKRNVRPVALPQAPGEVVEFTTMEGFDGELIHGIYQTADGRIWLSGTKAVKVFDGKGFRSFNAANGLGPRLGRMVEDVDGNLWFASLNGAVKLVIRGLSSYGTDDGLGDRTIRSIYQTAAGDLYVVNGDWQVSRLTDRKFVTVRPGLGDVSTPVWTSNVAVLDSTSAWWFLTEGRLFRFDHSERLESLAGRRPSMVYDTGPDFRNGAFYVLFEDSHGQVWISTRSTAPAQRGLAVWDRSSNTLRTLGAAENFRDGNAPSAFCEDRAGNIWVGFYYGGLARYTSGRFTFFTGTNGAPEGFVTAFHLDKLGRLWIASAGSGLSRVDDPNAELPVFVNYSTANGLSSNNIRQITDDETGRIYVGTVRGVDRLSVDTGRVKHYTMADGLSDDFITVAFRAHDGSLWFGTQNGLSHLAPEPDLPAHAPPIMIGGLHVAGVKQPLSELGQAEVGQLQLNYTQSNLQIDFFSLSFASAELIRYQHKLEGADQDWSLPASERTMTYANLAPGTYRFFVRAVNADGVVSRAPAMVSFRIAPPFWSRWWFILASILLFGVIVYWVARASFLRKLELERVRTRIATDLHDDIGASLTRIAMLSEVTRRQPDGIPATSAHRLTQIADNARTLVDSMSDIVWAIDPERDSLLDLTRRMRRHADELFTLRDIELNFNAPDAKESLRVGVDVRRDLLLIFKEAVNNAARHSHCTRVNIDLRVQPSKLLLEIIDNGTGFDQSIEGQGHGLRSMKRRAAALGGTLAIESRSGLETMIRVSVPLSRAGRSS